MSARSPTTLMSPSPATLRPLMTPTTPVRPRPVTTSSQPNSRKRSATNAAVRCTSYSSSGCSWMSRRQAWMSGCRSATRLTMGMGNSVFRVGYFSSVACKRRSTYPRCHRAPFTRKPTKVVMAGLKPEARLRARHRGRPRLTNRPRTDGNRKMPGKIEGDFDYIVVGAGTAGCIMANRLSADPKNRVLILEAGGNDNWIWFHIPVGYLFAIGNPRSDWMFKTEAEPGLNGRSLAYPRGKVIGGSSAINAMISMRGQAADYDHWRQLGLAGWGYDDVLPAFRRLEDHFLGASEHHGTGGGWRIEAARLSWAILDAVGDAAEEMGIRRIPDFNTGDNEGVGYFHVNQKRGRRWSSARGFLKPALKRSNLRLEKNVLVDRLIVENGRAAGVIFDSGGERIEARAKGEVILCAGSIGS